jgi:protein involved in polysaccharide export with SLBB domain
MNMRSWVISIIGNGMACLAMLLSTPFLVAQGRVEPDAQSDAPSYDSRHADAPYSDRTHAIDEIDSRAEKEAEQVVALPAEKIITLLQQEPGLLLQVKRMLARKAFQQGQILDHTDLTEDALFRLIRRDANIRVLVTKEIEDRNYIRAKPSREEMERETQAQSPLSAGSGMGRNQSQMRGTGSQEQQYWSQQERQQQYSSPQYSSPPFSNSPLQQPPQQNTPQNLSPDDSRRLLQAEAQTPAEDSSSSEAPLSGAGGAPQLSSEQISQLVSVYMNSRGTGSAGALQNVDMSKMSAILGGGNPALAASPASTFSPRTPTFAAGDEQPPPRKQARLQAPQRPSIPPLQSGSSSDQPLLQRRANPYADVPSLYDLYSQYARRSPGLTRFGTEVFENGTGNFDQLPMDLPVGPEYVLGPGDGLNIDLWGSFSQRLRRVVDREGRLALPEVGAVQVSGRTLGDVQHLVQTALRSQFREVEADVSLSRLRTIRVYVVGDVRRAGAYDVSSLSTPLNALYQAGGPTSRGSMRMLRHFHGKQLVENVDVYDLLLNGVQAGMQRLESGDTILVPPIGAEVTIEGMVRRPAIYELNGEKNLAETLQLAGGVLPSGTLRHVDVERVEAHQSRSMLRLDIPENNNEKSVAQALENFNVQDGDKIKISPILPFTDKTVYLEGHVFRPGKYAYRDGMKVTDLIKSYSDLLPEPYKRHAEIIRLKTPDFTPEVLAFSLEDALSSKDQDLALKPFDTVRVFGRFDFEDPPVITVTGEVRDPGDHVTNGATYLRDAVYLAGSTTPDAELDNAQVFRKTADGKLRVLSVNLGKALADDQSQNILLQPQDRLFISKNVSKVDQPSVSIEGEVARPGKYPLGEGMSAAQLVQLAGGLKRSAYTQEADLTRYPVAQGDRVEGEHITVQIAKALAGEADTDMRLRAGDVLTIGQISGWGDIGASMQVAGEVVHPGTYGIEAGERLSSILARAGGFRGDAYPYGAILERAQVRELEEKSRAELIHQIQQEETGLRATIDDPVSKESSLSQWRDTLNKLQNTPPAGRQVIHISANVKQWANTPADIQVRASDVLFIPKRPNFVMVNGAVYNQTAITFKPGKSAAWYLHRAGGPTTMADKKAIFVVRADGIVSGGKGGLFTGSALDAALQPGDMVVVPDRAFGGGFKWKESLQVAQLVSAVGIAIQVARGF